ncbi:MAG: reverse transcriptase/maturase family protein [Patescibacteria group bacterium]
MLPKTLFTYENIYQAYLKCRRRKRKTINALKFEYELENNLYNLMTELKARTYKPNRSTCFVVTDPTVREIFAADFRDRVVHHLFVTELDDIAEASFSFDSFACRKDKGTHAAVKRLRFFIPKVTRNNKEQAYCLQLDVSAFFMTIDHNILFNLVKKYLNRAQRDNLWKDEMFWLAKIIIYSKATGNFVVKGKKENFALLPKGKSLFEAGKYKGLPIGNLTSQFFANLYMNEVDQFIKRSLKHKYFIRYVDDLLILNRSEAKLKKTMVEIDRFLNEKLGLALKNEKTKLRNINRGIDFLGYYIKPGYTLIRKRVVKRMWAKISLIQRTMPQNQKRLKDVLTAYFGHFKHGNSYFLGVVLRG